MTKPRLVPTEVAAASLGVKPDAVRQLAARGRLTRYGTRTVALYDLRECLEIVRSRRRVA